MINKNKIHFETKYNSLLFLNVHKNYFILLLKLIELCKHFGVIDNIYIIYYIMFIYLSKYLCGKHNIYKNR